MTPKRRRWLTALGIFLATAVGGAIAYLFARRRRTQRAPEETAVGDLAARLRHEAAAQEERLRRRSARARRLGRRVGRRVPAAADSTAPGGTDDAAALSSPAAGDAAGKLRGDAGADADELAPPL